jgi:hypothetical protein
MACAGGFEGNKGPNSALQKSCSFASLPEDRTLGYTMECCPRSFVALFKLV